MGRFWPLVLLGALAILFYQTRPSWLMPRIAMPTPTPTVNVVAYVAEAQSALSRGDYAAAIAAYAKIAALEPDNPEPWISTSQLYMIEQDIPAAHESAAKAVALAPDNAAALTALARAEDWLGNYDTAAEYADAALSHEPENVDALAVMAEIYTDVGSTDLAQTYLDQARALDDRNVLMLRNQAYLYERLGKYDEALAALDQALAIDPQRADLYMEKARFYRIGKGDFAQALAAYRAAVDANKTAVTLDALGEGLYNAGDHIQAVRVLRGGGRFIACLPNMAHWICRWWVLTGRFPYVKNSPTDFLHLRFFTVAEAKALCRARGLQVVDLDGSASLWAREFYPPIIRWRRLRRSYTWLARRWPSLFARDFVLVCQKPLSSPTNAKDRHP